jgi:hypothetical protein
VKYKGSNQAAFSFCSKLRDIFIKKFEKKIQKNKKDLSKFPKRPHREFLRALLLFFQKIF